MRPETTGEVRDGCTETFCDQGGAGCVWKCSGARHQQKMEAALEVLRFQVQIFTGDRDSPID